VAVGRPIKSVERRIGETRLGFVEQGPGSDPHCCGIDPAAPRPIAVL
jgi:hypothetical protein